MQDYIEFHGRRFDFEKEVGHLRVFKSYDNKRISTVTECSSKPGIFKDKTYKNDCVFILDPNKEEINRYKLNKKGNINKKTAYKFILQNGSLKKWGVQSSQDPNLNLHYFNSVKKDKAGDFEEDITYYIQYTPEELKAFVNSIFKNLKQPCFEMTTIIRFFKDGGKTEDKKRLKENIYRYVLLPNKKYDSFEMPQDSERKHIKKIKIKDAIIYEDNTKYHLPKEYSLHAKERFKQNLDCYRVANGVPFYEEYLKRKKKLSTKKSVGKNKELSFKDFLLKNQKKKLRKSGKFADDYAFGTFQEEYEQNKDIYAMLKKGADDSKVSKEEFIELLQNKRSLYNSYDELKLWIEETKRKEPRGYGLTIGKYLEPSIKRYFSTDVKGYYFYKDIVLMFSVDGYGKDFIYEFKTCIARTVEHNLKFAKEQANLYAYLTEKKKIIIEIFSYEEDKINYYEYPVDRDKAKEQLEKFYEGYKLYLKDLTSHQTTLALS